MKRTAIFVAWAMTCASLASAITITDAMKVRQAATLQTVPNVQVAPIRTIAPHPAEAALPATSDLLAGSQATAVAYSYDDVGNLTEANYQNGIKTLYAYDRRDRLTELLTSKASAPLLHQVLARDASGLCVGILEEDASGPLRVIEYQYDAVKRLTREQISHRQTALSKTTVWIYDKVGNRLSETVTPLSGPVIRTTFVYNANDRLTGESTVGGAGAGTTTYIYDASGNMRRRSAPDGVVDYTYNGLNQLVQMQRGAERAEFRYDASGLLVAKTVFPGSGAPVAQHFVWDRNRKIPQIVEELKSENGGAFAVSARYVFADNLIAQTRDGVTSYVLADGMGSTRGLASSTGTVTDTFAYDAFGNLTERTGSTPTAHLYRGEQLDPNLGFYNLRARWMDPTTGRFTQIDPFPGVASVPTSLHDYVYVGNDPVNEEDPSGLSNLVELQTGQSIQNTGRSMPAVPQTALQIARRTKIWDVFTYQVLWPWHSYMYTERKGTRGGERFDVGADDRWAGIWQGLAQAPFSPQGGFVQARSAFRHQLKGKGVRVAQFSFGQQLLWRMTVIGAEDYCRLDYSVVPGVGSNCTSWTLWATGKAVFISRIKI